MVEFSLQQIFTLTPAVCSRYLHFDLQQLIRTLKLMPECNEAYQTPVTSNVRLISSWVTRKVSSVLLDYVLKVEQGLGLPDGDSRTCRSRYVSKGKVR